MLNEFKKFAMRGNVMDMAVGVVIGGAFGKIISSLVADVIMPMVGQLTGGMDFSNMFYLLGQGSYATLAEAQEAGVAVIAYGSFINAVIDFIIIAWCIFVVVKIMNKLKKKEAAKPETPAKPTKDQELLTEIRDLMKKKK